VVTSGDEWSNFSGEKRFLGPTRAQRKLFFIFFLRAPTLIDDDGGVRGDQCDPNNRLAEMNEIFQNNRPILNPVKKSFSPTIFFYKFIKDLLEMASQ
jgi:hypothetical protein